jgi:SAM-dependent methyltransferase
MTKDECPSECPACAAVEDFRLIDKRRGYPIYQCETCAVQFAYPVTLPDNLYDTHEAYWLLNEMSIKGTRLSDYMQVMLKQIDWEGKHLLDLGCGTGVFLQAAQARGAQVAGLDLNPKAISKTRELTHSERLYTEDVESFCENPPEELGHVDVVTMFQILEHLLQPLNVMRNVYNNLLESGGILVCSVPHRERRIDRYSEVEEPPHHVTWWSEEALCNLLRQAGFTDIKVILSPASIRPYVHYMLVNPFTKSLFQLLGNNKAHTQQAESSREKPVEYQTQPQSGLTNLAVATKLTIETIICAPIDLILRLAGEKPVGLTVVGRKV